jgi:hypothetical protein
MILKMSSVDAKYFYALSSVTIQDKNFNEEMDLKMSSIKDRGSQKVASIVKMGKHNFLNYVDAYLIL